MRNRSNTWKSFVEGWPFGPRSAPSWRSRSSKNLAVARTARRSVVTEPATRCRRCGLRARTHPSEELRRHISEVANDPGIEDRILFSWRELLKLRCSPDLLCHVGERTLVGRPTGANANRAALGDDEFLRRESHARSVCSSFDDVDDSTETFGFGEQLNHHSTGLIRESDASGKLVAVDRVRLGRGSADKDETSCLCDAGPPPELSRRVSLRGPGDRADTERADGQLQSTLNR